MSFSYFTPFPVAHGKVPSDQSNFPVYVPINDARFKSVGNGGHVQSANGYDLRPYNDTGPTTALTYELVTYNATTGVGEMYAKQNITAAVDAPINLFYGDASLTTDGSSTSTWDTNFKSVWHMKDGTTLSMSESTSSANTLTNNGTVAASTGQIGGAMRSNGSSSYLSGGVAGLTHNAASTIEMWVKEVSGSGALKGFLGLENSSNKIALGYFDGTRNGFLIVNAFGSSKPSATVTITSLNYLVIVNDGSNRPSLYVNGAQVDTNDGAALSGWVGTGIHLGRGVSSSFYAAADIDEPRLSSTGRSANWITASYNNQFSPSTFAVMGTEVPISSGTTVNAGCGLLTVTGFAPTVSTPRNVLAGVGAATLNGFAPTIATPRNVAAGVGVVLLTGFAPTIAAGSNVAAGVGVLSATGFAPAIGVTNNRAVLAGAGLATLSGFAPSVFASSSTRVNAGVGLLILSGFAPVVVGDVVTVPAITLASELRDISPSVRVRVLDLTPRVTVRTGTLRILQ